MTNNASLFHNSIDAKFLSMIYHWVSLGRRKETILISQILSTIRLSENRDASWVQPPRLLRTPCRNPKTQRCIVHTVDHNTLMLRAVLAPSANMGLKNMSAIKQRHLSVCFDPDLVARVFGNQWKASNVQAEFPCLGELA